MAVQTEPKVEPKVEPQVEPKVEPKVEPALITRVSQVKPPEKPPVEGKFNINTLDAEIEKITDPAVKTQVQGLKKSLLSGENQKYQEIATLRKQYETKLAESTNWTPERVKAEMNKPDFIQSAQVVLGNGTVTEEASALSEADKKELKLMRDRINVLQNSNWQAQKTNQDAKLTEKYANYAPDMVDTVTTDLMNNKRVATREDLWKVIDYEPAVNRAYALGLSDKIVIDKEKAAGITHVDGSGNVTTSPVLERKKDESVQQFMSRSYQTHTAKK